MAKRPVFNAELGRFFTALREAKGWKQSQAADVAARRQIAVTYQTIRGLEEGKTKNADPEALRAIAELYDYPYELIAKTIFIARFGVTASGRDLVWQSVDQQSEHSSDAGALPNDTVAVSLVELQALRDQVAQYEKEAREVRTVFDSLRRVTFALEEIRKTPKGKAGRGGAHRKTG